MPLPRAAISAAGIAPSDTPTSSTFFDRTGWRANNVLMIS